MVLWEFQTNISKCWDAIFLLADGSSTKSIKTKYECIYTLSVEFLINLGSKISKYETLIKNWDEVQYIINVLVLLGLGIRQLCKSQVIKVTEKITVKQKVLEKLRTIMKRKQKEILS